MKRWSEIETKKVIELCNNSKNYQEIAEIVGRTKKAVRLRLNRLGVWQNNDVKYETVVCGCCGNEFKFLKSDGRKFCSSSCSATFNNGLRANTNNKHKEYKQRKRKEYKLRKKNNCLNCGEITTNKFCKSACQHQHINH